MTVVSFNEADKDLVVRKLNDYGDVVHIGQSMRRKPIKSSVISREDGFSCYSIKNNEGSDFDAAIEFGAVSDEDFDKIINEFAGGNSWYVADDWDEDKVDDDNFDLIVVWNDEVENYEVIKPSKSNSAIKQSTKRRNNMKQVIISSIIVKNGKFGGVQYLAKDEWEYFWTNDKEKALRFDDLKVAQQAASEQDIDEVQFEEIDSGCHGELKGKKDFDVKSAFRRRQVNSARANKGVGRKAIKSSIVVNGSEVDDDTLEYVKQEMFDLLRRNLPIDGSALDAQLDGVLADILAVFSDYNADELTAYIRGDIEEI